MLFVSRLKKNERDLLKVLDVLLEATERRKSLRRGRQFEDDPELAGFVLDQKRTTRQSSALDESLQGFERQVDTRKWCRLQKGTKCPKYKMA